MKINKIIAAAMAFAIVGGTVPSVSDHQTFSASASTVSDIPSTSIEETETGDYTEFPENGIIYHLYSDHAVVSGYDESLTGDITIPSKVKDLPVTTIGTEAFYENQNITSVSIPDSVSIIDNRAFCNCNSLTSAKLPDTITKAGSSIFANCNILTNVNIPTSLTTIPIGFLDNTAISSVTIPETVTKIGSSAFEFCKELKEIEIPSSVTEISSFAFSYSGLTKFTVPDSVTKIESYAFSGCNDLETLNYTDSVTFAGQNIVKNTAWIKNKKAEDPIVMINNLVIDGTACKGDVTLPDNAEIVCGIAFRNNKEMTSVTIPASVKQIDYCSFEMCTGLQSITFLNPECKIYSSKDVITNYRDEEKKENTFTGTIYGYEGSTAQKAAERFGYNFAVIGSSAPTTSTTSTTSTTTTATVTTTSTTSESTTTTSKTTSSTTSSTTTPSGSTEPVTAIPGDVDKNGIITATDASAILVLYAELSANTDLKPTEEQFITCDVDKNKTIGAIDASLVLSFYSYIAEFPDAKFDVYLDSLKS